MLLAHKGKWFVEFFMDGLIHFLVRTQLDLVPVPAIYLYTMRIKWKCTDYTKLSLTWGPVLSSVSEWEQVLRLPLVCPQNQTQFSLPTLTFPFTQALFPDNEYWRLSLVWEHLPHKYCLKKPCKATTVQFFFIQSKPQTFISVHICVSLHPCIAIRLRAPWPLGYLRVLTWILILVVT